MAQLRAVFEGQVKARGWRLEKPPPPAAAASALVDVATLAARRLSRRAGQKGFGNARAAWLLLQQAIGRANDRMVLDQVQRLSLTMWTYP